MALLKSIDIFTTKLTNRKYRYIYDRIDTYNYDFRLDLSNDIYPRITEILATNMTPTLQMFHSWNNPPVSSGQLLFDLVNLDL